jgi:hypothetical protein
MFLVKTTCVTLKTMMDLAKLILIIALLAGAYYGYVFYYKDGTTSEVRSVVNPSTELEIGQIVTTLFEKLSKEDLDGVYAMVTQGFKKNIPRQEVSNFISVIFTNGKFKAHETTGHLYAKGEIETTEDVYKDEWIYENYGKITLTGGDSGETLVVLVEENNQWKIQFFDISLNKQ